MITECSLKFLLFFVILIVVPEGMDSEILETGSPKGVYWRPWSSTIPEDAIVAGNRGNNFNESLYMGNVLLLVEKGGLQPCRILEGGTEVYATSYGPHHSSENVNILCASDPSLVTWKHQSDVPYVNDNPELVVAGVEAHINNNIFFGKVTYKGETFVGKVQIWPGTKIMYYYYYGSEYSASENFEIRAYTQALNSNVHYS